MLKWFQNPEKRWQQWQKQKKVGAWHVLDFGRHSFRGHDQVLHLESHQSANEKVIVNFYPKSREIELLAADKFIFKAVNWRQEIVPALEAHLAPKITWYTEMLKQTPPQNGDATAEARGEEWLKTSLVVLERALAGLTPDQRLQSTIFIGEKDLKPTLRIIVFNLDLSFVYHLDKAALQVTCFNKKEQEQFDYSKPDFDGAFSALAFPVFDRAINLTRLISEAILRESLR